MAARETAAQAVSDTMVRCLRPAVRVVAAPGQPDFPHRPGAGPAGAG
ncbi:hypothetical protein [Kitasatospora sp. NPDC001527]